MVQQNKSGGDDGADAPGTKGGDAFLTTSRLDL